VITHLILRAIRRRHPALTASSRLTPAQAGAALHVVGEVILGGREPLSDVGLDRTCAPSWPSFGMSI